MLVAVLATLATYIYLQWGTFVTTIFIAGAAAIVGSAICAIYVADRPRADDVEQITARRNKLAKWAVALAIFGAFMPSQKTLGTSVAVGAAAYATSAVVTSEVVQKFLLLVNKEANSMMDDRLKDLQNKTEPAKPEPAK